MKIRLTQLGLARSISCFRQSKVTLKPCASVRGSYLKKGFRTDFVNIKRKTKLRTLRCCCCCYFFFFYLKTENDTKEYHYHFKVAESKLFEQKLRVLTEGSALVTQQRMKPLKVDDPETKGSISSFFFFFLSVYSNFKTLCFSSRELFEKKCFRTGFVNIKESRLHVHCVVVYFYKNENRK